MPSTDQSQNLTVRWGFSAILASSEREKKFFLEPLKRFKGRDRILERGFDGESGEGGEKKKTAQLWGWRRVGGGPLVLLAVAIVAV